MISDRDDDAAVNDIITLTGLSKVTHWKFPNINYCPHPNCHEDFETQAEAINHYSSMHSDQAILCSICDEPIYTYSIDGFKEHFRNSHPDSQIPIGFNETSDNRTNDQMSQQIDEVRLNSFLIIEHFYFFSQFDSTFN